MLYLVVGEIVVIMVPFIVYWASYSSSLYFTELYTGIVGGQDTARDNHCMIQREVEILNLDTNTLRNGEQKFPKVKLSILQLTLYI